MPPEEPTTTVPAPAAPVATVPPTNGQADEQSSKELARLGVEVNDWKAKYDGLIGSSRARTNALNETIAGRDLTIAELQGKVATLEAQLAEANGKVEQLPALQTQLAEAQSSLTAATSQSNKQSLLIKFPNLLKGQSEDGTNPLVDLILSSGLPEEELAVKAQALAASWGNGSAPTIPAAGGTPPPSPAASGGGEETPTEVQVKALAAHDKYKASGFKDLEAKAEADRLWAKHRQLTKSKP